MFLWLSALPWSMWADSHWAVVPITGTISYLLLGIGGCLTAEFGLRVWDWGWRLLYKHTCALVLDMISQRALTSAKKPCKASHNRHCHSFRHTLLFQNQTRLVSRSRSRWGFCPLKTSAMTFRAKWTR